MKEILRLDHVTRTYERPGRETVTALDDANLCLMEGAIRFVYGSSGSGKSTLLLCAGGLLRPDRGTVTLNGTDIYKLSGEERSALRARHIGFVFQQFHLIPYLNVMENILAPALAGYDGDPRPRAERLVERFGLGHRLEHPPSELSVGERQRVALARALLYDPELLLADEPTGNLDERNGAEVMKCLEEFAGAGGAVLVVTHDARHITEDAFQLENGTLKPGAASTV